MQVREPEGRREVNICGDRGFRRRETKDPLMGVQDAGTKEEYRATIRDPGSNAANGVRGRRYKTAQTDRGVETTGGAGNSRKTRAEPPGKPDASGKGG